jgi:DeoR family transcriptional regulator of aga operon
VFVTCGGVHPEVGITEYNLDDARVKRAILEGAARRVVLADHRKLDHVAFSVVCPPEGFDVLITGSEAEESVVHRLREAGAEVLVA